MPHPDSMCTARSILLWDVQTLSAQLCCRFERVKPERTGGEVWKHSAESLLSVLLHMSKAAKWLECLVTEAGTDEAHLDVILLLLFWEAFCLFVFMCGWQVCSCFHCCLLLFAVPRVKSIHSFSGLCARLVLCFYVTLIVVFLFFLICPDPRQTSDHLVETNEGLNKEFRCILFFKKGAGTASELTTDQLLEVWWCIITTAYPKSYSYLAECG